MKENELDKKNKELSEELEKLKRQIKALKSKKKYGLVWEEEKEPEKIILDCQYKIPILKEVKSKRILTKEEPTNIIIEGDNYHALSVLNYTHRGKIDVIYIDPPYNTGNGDTFRYNDKIVDKEDTFRHSKWLSFMSKRLMLANNLLKPTGVLFISIDDNEVAQLKLLCDEIFGEQNFVSTLVWEKVRIRKNSALYFTSNHDFILCIAKRKKQNEKDVGWARQLSERGGDSNYKNPDNDPNGPWLATSITANHPYSADYKIKKPNGVVLHKPKNASWRYSWETLQKFIKEDRIIWGKDRQYPKVKRYLKDVKEGLVPKSIFDFFTFGGNPDGANELKELFGGNKVFENPKPSKLIKNLIKIGSSNKKAIILDFFAGTGTTGHAVLKLNGEDGGSRKFIICTNNENNICTEVCYPRIQKIIKGGKNIEGLGGSLVYFKTELLDIDHISHVSDEQKIKLTYQAGEIIALRESTFIEVEKDDWWQIFKDGTKYTAIYFKEDKKKLNELVKKLSKLKEEVALYIFSWGKNEYKNEFTEYKNIKIEDIPEPIIDVYKEVNRLS